MSADITDNFAPAWLDAQLDVIGRGGDKVIPLLMAIQKQYNYLPQSALKYLSDNSEISPADIAGVSTFYTQFRHIPAGQHNINVCVGTACHVKGAELVYDSFRRHLCCGEGQDTDPQKLFTINKVACLGCCSLAVAVQIDDIIYGHVTAAGAHGVIEDFLGRQSGRGDGRSVADGADKSAPNEIRIAMNSCCAASGSVEVASAAREIIDRYKLPVKIKRVGCVSMCHQTPLIEIIANGVSHRYARVEPDDIQSILLRHFRPSSMIDKCACWIDEAAESLFLSEPRDVTAGRRRIDMGSGAADNFFNKQKHVAIEHFGTITPLDIDEYISKGGFEALKRCLTEMSAGEVIDIVKDSGLRGRGGAGFPTGTKWEMVRKNAVDVDVSIEKFPNGNFCPRNGFSMGDLGLSVLGGALRGYPPSSKEFQKLPYIICNGDEGDPGAFMDRMLLESFPYRIIEGMLIAAYAVGARSGIFYIRAEYPFSIKVMREALDICEKRGLLGDNILDSDFSLKLTIVEGAGAFVCGEETALIQSIEGKRGTPTPKPPYPAERGLWGKPTLINNCETFACVPWIVRNGAAEFRKIGTPESSGTKVFALAGKVAGGGFIETPMGQTISDIVEHIGGGIAGGKRWKAVQIGGPSGGCIPASMGHIPVDYEELSKAGAMMGSGGLVVLDESDCMVDIAKYFLTFTQSQSCGRCTFCRVGTRRMLDILEKICMGKGVAEDLRILEELALSVKSASLCGLGKTAPNPVLTTMKYFREEYEAHVNGECPAGKCKDLIAYKVTEKCTTGCTICSQNCPAGAIPFTPYDRPVIDDESCTRCGVCKAACPEGAINIIPRKMVGII